MYVKSVRIAIFVVAAVVGSARVLATGPATGARRQMQNIRAELHESRAKGDWHSYRKGAVRLKDLLNGSPPSLLEVVRADVHVGDTDAAIRELGRIARMGQFYDLPAISKEFDALVKTPAYAKVGDAMQTNRGEISRATMAFELADPGLLAEDVDYDPATRRFFITSVDEKKIVATAASGAHSTFAKSPDGWPMFAVKVDSKRGVVWATEVALRGYKFAPKADWGKSAVLRYSLKTGKLLRRIEGPSESALGDMTLTMHGDVIVSDGTGGGVYRLRAKGDKLERLDGGQFISPQTPAMAPDGKRVFVPDYLRGIGILDLATKQVRWLAMHGKFALNGIDGLYFHAGKLIAVQNGTSPARVIVFMLDDAFAGIDAEKIIERSSATLGSPTHGVIVDDDFYYIAHSGWDSIDDQGNLKPGAKPFPARIMRAPLRNL